MKIRIRRILIPVLAVFSVALLVEVPLSETTFFGEAVILWDTLFRAVLAVPLLLHFYREDAVFRGEERFFHRKTFLKETIGFLLGGVLLALFLSAAVKFLGIPGHGAADGPLFVGPIWLQFLVLLLASPFLEELFFRGVLYGRLKEMVPTTAAALLSALFFGLYHGNPAQGIYGFLLGLYLAFAMEKTRTVMIPIFIHGAVNALSLLLASGNLP